MKLPEEPLWRPVAGAAGVHPPPPIAAWLRPASSLTHRLRQTCGSGFAVRVLSQGWARPLPDEALALAIAPGRRAFVRRVQLLCNGTPWVFGRTVIPASTLRGRRRRLAHLGETPLGAVLFSDPGLRRESVDFARIAPPCTLFADAAGAGAANEVWARRCRYRLKGRRLLVTEVFLPAISRAPPAESLARRLGRHNGGHHG